MAIHKKDILTYLERNPIWSYQNRVESLLEILCRVYTEYNMTDTEEIKKSFQELDDLLELIPRERREELYTISIDLCIKHEVGAFSHGILVGMHLLAEINALP